MILFVKFESKTRHDRNSFINSRSCLDDFPRKQTTMRLLFTLLAVSLRLSAAFPTHEDQRDDVDGEQSRKIIGQR